MRLATYRDQFGKERAGVVHNDTVLDVQDLSRATGGSLPDSMQALIEAGPEALEALRDMVAGLDGQPFPAGSRPYSLRETMLLAPIPRPRKNVFCLGKNYVEHAHESNRARGEVESIPEAPIFFTKAATSVIGPEEPILIHQVTNQVDWEIELAIVVGRRGRDIPASEAMDYIFGYTIVNDISARDLQFRHGQFFKGKSLDGACPMGPWILTADEIPDPHALSLRLWVNGVLKQDGSTRDLIYDVPAIIASLSAGLTLEPGDVIATGTPAGVGFARKPPEFLQAGDVVELEIEGIGRMRNPVARANAGV